MDGSTQRGGSLEAHPLEKHFSDLEEAVELWLEASYYKTATPEKQKVMRAESLLPTNASAEMPEPYRLWRMCQRNNTLWWDGGMSNQPHILMLEFAVCETAYNSFQEQRNNMERIVDGSAR